jgi:hypothetical protein
MKRDLYTFFILIINVIHKLIYRMKVLFFSVLKTNYTRILLIYYRNYSNDSHYSTVFSYPPTGGVHEGPTKTVVGKSDRLLFHRNL